ncbi:hypothetical protein [Streptomyces sp. ICBB 8177]|uniref:hypothetical protein n=1 Tax=Streptomyces sp. ICBB 8177 TaxID=563922 RepID=UPI0011B5E536|nr:hypothetical protein [Streptomyces sp. ICBB 8177]
MADEVPDADHLAQAREFWARAFSGAGLDIDAPHTTAVVQLVSKQLERLVMGMLEVREGNERMEPNPEEGMDYQSALEMTSLLRELRQVAQVGHVQGG